MELLLRVSGIAIAALVLLFVLRGTSGNFVAFVKVSAVILLFGMIVLELSESIVSVRALISTFIDADSFVGISLSVMVKALGIALIGRLCADICRECGESGLAQCVETAAGVVILSLSMPILSEILNFASDVLKRGS